MRAIDPYVLIGKTYGRWKVLTYVGKRGINKSPHFFKCRCSCGTIRNVNRSNLIKGKSKSCGCLLSELLVIRNFKHGSSKTLTYYIWAGMWERCTCSNNAAYKWYGKKGIKICSRWKTYLNFLHDMGEKPDKLTLDRIDNNKGYCKENCRWSTPQVQANNRSNNHLITYCGSTKTIAQWARIKKLKFHTLLYRIIRYGWDVDKALNTPCRG